MTTDASQTVATTGIYRLLGHPTDLPGHLGTFGALPIAGRRSLTWAGSFLASLERSGLTGRGGAAFPTSIKAAVARDGGGPGVIVVNGMEGEPASDKDKVLLTRAPHLVLDGAQLLAALTGAERVVVCVPVGRDPIARSVEHAVAERRADHYAHVAESVLRPPDRFVAGEESALVHWIESGHALPALRRDKSVPLRIGQHAALVHNVETLAHVALIARHGEEGFRSRGLVEEPGTTLVTVSGAVAHPGVVEVDRGTPLRDIVARSEALEPMQALLVGGYGGTWVGAEHLSTPYASLSLRTIGASAGVGIVVVLGVSGCGIAESARLARYMARQSSGQCGPCVFGLPTLADDLERLARGRSDAGLMARLARRLDQVDGRGACRHPDGVVAMVRSALSVFSADVAAHDGGEPCLSSLGVMPPVSFRSVGR